jgi:hypothetical protein
VSGVRFERIDGVREDLPAGERVLWQGAPSWRSLARHAFHVREVAAYFCVLAAVTVASALADGQPATAGLLPAALGAAACALLAALAWWSSRTTIYAITTRRVFLRVGIALPIAINLPLHRIQEARFAPYRDGCGDLPLFLGDDAHLGYLHLWPHARPWRLRRPEPMMRSVADAARVARILADALGDAHGAESAGDGSPSVAPSQRRRAALAAAGGAARAVHSGARAAA